MGGEPGKFSRPLSLAKAMDDVMVAYAQDGEPMRPEQGYPVRQLVPGSGGPFSVKGPLFAIWMAPPVP